MPKRKHPIWFDPDGRYDCDEWKFAVALGRGVALTSMRGWTQVEVTLQELWEDLDLELPWASVRCAIYAGWWVVRRDSVSRH